MPELPEVETIRRDLEKLVIGKTIDRVEILDPRIIRLMKNDQFELALPGHVSDGPVTMERARVVMSRIGKIVEIE